MIRTLMETKEILVKSDLAYLAAIKELAANGLAVSASGLRLVLLGEGQEEAASLSCYGYYANLPSRQFHSRIHLLHRHGYLRLRYEKKMRDYALELTEAGAELARFVFRKRSRKEPTPSIIRIEEENL